MSHCSRSLALVIALTVVACLAGTMTALAVPCLAGKTGVPAGRSPEGLSAEALLAQAEKELQADPKVADPVRFYCELLYFRLQKGDKAGYKQALAKAREALEKFAATDPDSWRPGQAQMALAVSQVKAGDVSGGKDTALPVQETADSGALVEALVAAGDLDGAIKVARASRIHGWSSWARVATYLVHTGRVEEAEKTIADLPNSYRHGILEEILMVHARAGDAEKFQKTLPEVQRLLETVRIGINLYDYVRVIAALAVMGDKKGVDLTMRQAKDFAGTMTPGRRLDPEFVVWQHTAAALGRAGKVEEAKEALAHLKSPNSHKWFVIQALAARGDPEKAEALGPDDLANLHLAVAWFKKGNKARYQELIRKDIARAEGMKGWSDRHGDFGEMELGRVARAQLLVGDWEGAKQTMADSAFAGTKVLNRYVATGIAWGWAASGKTDGLWEWLDQFTENADRPFVYLAAAEGLAGLKTNLMGSFDDERFFEEFSIWAAIEDPPVQPQPAAPPYREVNVPPVWADSADGRYRVTVGSVRRGFRESRSPVPMSISLDFHRVDPKSHETIIDFWLKPSAIVDEGSTIQVKGPGGEDLKATDTSWARFGSWDVEVPDGVTRLAEVRLRLLVFTPSEWETFEFRDLGEKESTPRNLGPIMASFSGRKTEFYALLWCSKPEDEAYKAWQARTGLRVVPLDVIQSYVWAADAAEKPLKAIGGGLEDAQSGRREFGDEGQTGGKWVWNEIKYPIRASVEVPEAGTVRSVEFVLKDVPLPGPDVWTLFFSPETVGQPPRSALPPPTEGG